MSSLKHRSVRPAILRFMTSSGPASGRKVSTTTCGTSVPLSLRKPFSIRSPESYSYRSSGRPPNRLRGKFHQFACL